MPYNPLHRRRPHSQSSKLACLWILSLRVVPACPGIVKPISAHLGGFLARQRPETIKQYEILRGCTVFILLQAWAVLNNVLLFYPISQDLALMLYSIAFTITIAMFYLGVLLPIIEGFARVRSVERVAKLARQNDTNRSDATG